jgi:hypothetical protein
MQTHAMLPTIKHMGKNVYKIYFSGRDKNNVSQIGFCTAEIYGEEIVINSFSKEPIFRPGDRGCFDDNGVTPSCFLEDKMYYIGWNSGTSTYRMSLIMGLALEKKNKYFRYSRAPLLNKTDREPFGILTAPWVLKDKGVYKMWYVSGEGWVNKDLPKYNIKYAHSKDGIRWIREGNVSLELLQGETALARPNVIKSNCGYEMYFSYKIPEVGYRIGYAKSIDGIKFTRSNDTCLDVSGGGWDSEMVQYSCVFEHKGVKFMLYNGNGYGKTGIGYAIEK